MCQMLLIIFASDYDVIDIAGYTINPLKYSVHYTLEYSRCRGDAERETGILVQPLVGVDCNEFAGLFIQRQLIVGMC